MKELVPSRIINNYKRNKYFESFECYSLFVDISGFTSTTEALMKHGQEGAEVLSDILKYLFDTSVKAVYDNGGYVTKYAGDAFTAIFEKRNKRVKAENVLNAALITKKFFDDNKIFSSKYGDFDFGVKVGLGMGECNCGILGTGNEMTYYFSGEAVDSCANAEHNAVKGEIWLYEDIFKLLKHNIIKYSKNELNGKNFYRADRVIEPDPLSKPYKSPVHEKEIIYKLAGKLETEFPVGEFRNIISVFISFSGKKDISDLMKKVYELKETYGTSHPVLDYGDKGGNILFFVGAPISYENNIQRAVDFVYRLSNEIQPEIKLRAGLAKGVVYCGYNGSELRQEFTCLGNTVNQSARFMMQADWGQVLVDKEISNNQIYTFDHFGDIKYKGREEAIPTFKLNSKKEVKDIFFKGKFVGRRRERKKLRKYLEGLSKNRNCGAVYVDGPAGIGKSRLTNKIRQEMSDEKGRKGPKWSYFLCDEIVKQAYNPVKYYLNRLFEIKDDETPDTNYQKISNEIENICSLSDINVDKTRKDELKDHVAFILGMKVKDPEILSQEPGERKNNIFLSLIELFRIQASGRPYVFEIDNALFIDSESVEFFKRLAFETSGLPFAFILNCRYKDNGDQVDLGFPSQKRMKLKLMTKKDIRELILDRMDVPRLPIKTIDKIISKGRKNPLFIEQIIIYLKDNNLLDGKLRIVPKADIPDGLNQVVLARIDKLSTDLKDILKRSSVMGNEVSLEILTHILKQKYPDPEKYLTELENEDILIKVSEILYLFKYTVIRDVIYNIQLKKTVRKFHLMIGKAIEELSEENREKFYSVLAYHFEKAEETEKALFYNKEAALKAKFDYQNVPALDHCKRWIAGFLIKHNIKNDGIENFRKLPETELDDYIEMNLQSYYFSFFIFQDIESSKKIIEQMSSLTDLINNKKITAKIYSEKSHFLSYQGDFKSSNEKLETALKIFKKIKDRKNIVLTYMSLGKNKLKTGLMKEALDMYNRSLDHTEDIFDTKEKQKLRTRIYGDMGIIYDYSGEFDKAVEYYSKQLSLAEKLKLKMEKAGAIGNIGVVFHLKGDLKKAREYYSKKLELVQELGKRNEMAEILNNIGFLYKDLGEYNKALKYHKQSHKLSKEIKDFNTMSGATVNMGHVYKLQGDLDKAEEQYKKAVETAGLYGYRHTQSEGLIEMGDVYIIRNDKKKAEDTILKGLEIAKSIGFAEYIERSAELMKKL